jgi:hypothetical protein
MSAESHSIAPWALALEEKESAPALRRGQQFGVSQVKLAFP